MKINKIVYEKLENINKMKSFDMKEKPRKQKFYLKPITKLLSFPEVNKCNLVINKKNMENVKSPYLILCNHNSFIDFKVLTKAIYPNPANYIVAIDGFINREGLLRNVGCICKRKFYKEINIVKQIKYSLYNNKYICALYPEARYSHVGTTAILPESLGKMIKLLKCPVVTLICHGNHLRQPVWNLGYKRDVNITADMKCIITQEQSDIFSVEEINNLINKEFIYDDYQYQLKNNIKITEDTRALGLERVLYKCPHCLSEEYMKTKGTKIYCDNCHVEYNLEEDGTLKCLNKEGRFNQIPSWYEWERECVKEEVETGNYSFEVEADIDDLKNSKGFYRFGRGKLTQDMNGLHFKAMIDGKEFTLEKAALANYSVHVEYAYFGRGDAVSFSDENDSYYLFPVDNKNVVTKIHFATEEIYKYTKTNKKKDI